ncbi:hypothetical protein LCGC14_0427270 [marine sediment metagenome]|uniref:Uncharacterized protein n=1 Tax=marine sediment metagenome TaxID=412755 RepID=A0A0F9SP94_9ZZZZ
MNTISTSKLSLSADNELFDEESNVIHRLIRVKLVPLPNGGENWEVSNDNEVSLVVPGVRLTKREKSVLKTAQGINLLMYEYKLGNRSVANIKAKLREYWKIQNDKV